MIIEYKSGDFGDKNWYYVKSDGYKKDLQRNSLQIIVILGEF